MAVSAPSSRFLVRAAIAVLVAAYGAPAQSVYYVGPTGSNEKGTGSQASPWRDVAHAASAIPDDGSTIAVRDGIYTGRVRIHRRFSKKVVVRAANPYRAKLIATGEPVVTLYGAANVEVSGFEIAREPNAPGILLVHVQSSAENAAQNIVIRDNIIHDSYNNDLLKINNGARNILVESNIFYNQSGPDEHIDINGVADVTIRDNIFFNDFEGSGRINTNATASFIVIKNSAGLPDNKRIQIRRNVFLNWQGSRGAGFVSIGEDGKPFHEADDVLLENNLLIGNSPIAMRAPFTVKGAKNITFRNNTITGSLPARAFGARLTAERLNPPNENVRFYNNIWSSPGGMAPLLEGSPLANTGVVLSHNLYWNGGLPVSRGLSGHTDGASVAADPQLPRPQRVVLPRWTGDGFASGSRVIRQEFERLVHTYGVPGTGSPVVNAALSSSAPADDILGRPRDSKPDIGAVEVHKNSVPGTTGTKP